MDPASPGPGHEPHAGRDLLGACREVGGLGPAPATCRGAGLEPLLRRPELLLQRGDALLQLRPASARPTAAAARSSRLEPLLHERVRAGAGQRLDAAHPGADAPLAGDHEPADLARDARQCVPPHSSWL